MTEEQLPACMASSMIVVEAPRPRALWELEASSTSEMFVVRLPEEDETAGRRRAGDPHSQRRSMFDDSTLPLAGLRFAVQDSFAVAGHVTGFGSRLWLSTHSPETRTAPVLTRLVDNGAALLGKTIMAEFGYSLHARNGDYPTPMNAWCPHRMVGACSGAAAAVTAGQVDFAVAMDTLGSVAVPAAYCGAFAFRFTHHPERLEGVLPVSRTLDTMGLLTASPEVLYKLGMAILDLPPEAIPLSTERRNRQPTRLVAADDAIGLCSPRIQGVLAATAAALRSLNNKSAAALMAGVGTAKEAKEAKAGFRAPPTAAAVQMHQISHIHLGNALLNSVAALKAFTMFTAEEDGDGGGMLGVGRSRGLDAVRQLHRMLQAHDFSQQYKAWLDTYGDAACLPEDLRHDLAVAKHANNNQNLERVQKDVAAALDELLKDGTVLLLPTTPGPPPPVSLKSMSPPLRVWTASCQRINCLASIAGLPQVTIPVVLPDVDGPMAVSLIAARGQDAMLLDLALALSPRIQTAVVHLSRPGMGPGPKAPGSVSAPSEASSSNTAATTPMAMMEAAAARTSFEQSSSKSAMAQVLTGCCWMVGSYADERARQMPDENEPFSYAVRPVQRNNNNAGESERRRKASAVTAWWWVVCTVALLLWRAVWRWSGRQAVRLRAAATLFNIHIRSHRAEGASSASSAASPSNGAHGEGHAGGSTHTSAFPVYAFSPYPTRLSPSGRTGTRLTLSWGVWIATELALRRFRAYLPQGAALVVALFVSLLLYA